MRVCPHCRNTYTDDTLIYCLADGTLLERPDDDQPTVVRTSILTAEPTQVLPRKTAETTTGRSSGVAVKLVIGFAVLAVLAAIGVVAAVVAYYSVGGGRETYSEYPTPQTTPRSTPDQNEELKEKIAELERKLAEKENDDVPFDPSDFQIDIPMTGETRTGTVDSPNDGFLALRSLPSSEIGARLTKIPHGSTVTIGICGPAVAPGKRKGRWCQASYGGYSGWIFDGYINYGDSKKN